MHRRVVPASPLVAGQLIESLAGPDDRLWPTARWPEMRLDNGLTPGSSGGHGPVRYTVLRHHPGKEIAFGFTPRFPLHGEHRFEILAGDDGEQSAQICHTLEGKPHGYMVLAWPICFRWLHDALVEDALDQAEAQLRDRPWQPRRLPWPVRLLRMLLSGLSNRSQRGQASSARR